MNYAHNNLRIKKIQFKIEKTIKAVKTVYGFLKPSTEEVELQVIDKSLPQLPEEV